MAITASLVLSNIKRLLQDEALHLHEKEKLPSETYTLSVILSQTRKCTSPGNFCLPITALLCSPQCQRLPEQTLLVRQKDMLLGVSHL